MPPIDLVYLNSPDVTALALTDDETSRFWHRGRSLSDIALGCAMLDKARRLGLGQTLRFQ